MLELIKARRSVRKYTGEPVTDEQLKQLLEAAMAAPSASNRQPWDFVVVRDKTLLQGLGQVHQWSGMAALAPVVIVVCGREDVSRHWVEDCSAATQNLLLATTALGLGAVWVAVYPEPEREDRVRRLLRIPEQIRVLCIVPLGHPAEAHPPRTQYDPERVHQDGF